MNVCCKVIVVRFRGGFEQISGTRVVGLVNMGDEEDFTALFRVTHSVQFGINLSKLQDLLFRFVHHIENIFVVSELDQR